MLEMPLVPAMMLIVGRENSCSIPTGMPRSLMIFIPPISSPGFDWRVLVIGGRAVTAMKRVSVNWVHNVKQGARCEPAALTPALREIAEAAAQTLQMDYAGVDILPEGTQDALRVLEVNGVAAWQGLQRVTPFNIARALVDDLLDRRLPAARRGVRRA